MKKRIIQVIIIFVCAFIFGILGLGYLAGYGGNNCDLSYISSPDNFEELIPLGSCDCFCCHMFGVQGYESCGILGFIPGVLFGGIIGFFIVNFVYKKYEKKSNSKR